jgi:hypothetical protein
MNREAISAPFLSGHERPEDYEACELSCGRRQSVNVFESQGDKHARRRFGSKSVNRFPQRRKVNAKRQVSVLFQHRQWHISFLERFALILSGQQGRTNGQARWTNLESTSTLARPAVASLIDEAIARNRVPFARAGRGPILIRSASATKRRRRRSA